jgi:hypothetical protein
MIILQFSLLLNGMLFAKDTQENFITISLTYLASEVNWCPGLGTVLQ